MHSDYNWKNFTIRTEALSNTYKQPLSDYLQLNSLSSYDILVCTIGHKPMLKERMLILRDLWVAGLRADIYLEAMQVN